MSAERTERDILLRIEELLTILAHNAMCETISVELADPTLRKLYDATGSGSVTQLAKRFKFSAGKISGLWKKWEEAGLLIKDGKSFRKAL